jgi:hypothetical protein
MVLERSTRRLLRIAKVKDLFRAEVQARQRALKELNASGGLVSSPRVVTEEQRNGDGCIPCKTSEIRAEVKLPHCKLKEVDKRDAIPAHM